MSEAWLLDLIKFAPVPIVCLVVIYKLVNSFLRHMELRDAVLKTISDGCHSVQRDAIESMRRNTEQLGRVEAVLTRMNGGKIGVPP